MKERLDKVASLLTYLEAYRATGTLKMDVDTTQQLKQIYGEIFGVWNTNVGCGTCVVQYLDFLASWYELENAKFQATQTPIKESKKKK